MLVKSRNRIYNDFHNLRCTDDQHQFVHNHIEQKPRGIEKLQTTLHLQKIVLRLMELDLQYVQNFLWPH